MTNQFQFNKHHRDEQHAFYSDNDIMNIITSASDALHTTDLNALRARLEEVAGRFLWNSGIKKRPTPAKLKKELLQVVKWARRGITLLSDIDVQSNLAAATDRLNETEKQAAKGHVAVLSRLPDLVRIANSAADHHFDRHYVTLTKDREKTEVKNRRKHHAQKERRRYNADKTFDGYLTELSAIWETFTNRRASASMSNNNKHASPFIRFVLACYEPLVHRNPDLRKHTGIAIRRRWQRIGRIKYPI